MGSSVVEAGTEYADVIEGRLEDWEVIVDVSAVLSILDEGSAKLVSVILPIVEEDGAELMSVILPVVLSMVDEGSSADIVEGTPEDSGVGCVVLTDSPLVGSGKLLELLESSAEDTKLLVVASVLESTVLVGACVLVSSAVDESSCMLVVSEIVET